MLNAYAKAFQANCNSVIRNQERYMGYSSARRPLFPPNGKSLVFKFHTVKSYFPLGFALKWEGTMG